MKSTYSRVYICIDKDETRLEFDLKDELKDQDSFILDTPLGKIQIKRVKSKAKVK